MTADRFRALHRPGRPLFLPNAWDHASAVALVEAGFDVIGTTSLGVAAGSGVPDARGLARAETRALARRLADLPCLLTVDLEAGFASDPAEVAELAAELSGWGIVGINLEDGRPDGSLAEPARQSELIAAVKARVPGLFVNARIDTYWIPVADEPLPATLERAGEYVAAGADGIFVPAVADEREIRTLTSQVPVPVNVLYGPGGHSLQRLAELGASRVSTGSLLFRTALGAVATTARRILDGEPAGEPERVPTYAELQRRLEKYSGQTA